MRMSMKQANRISKMSAADKPISIRTQAKYIDAVRWEERDGYVHFYLANGHLIMSDLRSNFK